MPESSTRRSECRHASILRRLAPHGGARRQSGRDARAQSTPPARSIASSAIRSPDVDVRPDRLLRGGRSPASNASTIAPVLGARGTRRPRAGRRGSPASSGSPTARGRSARACALPARSIWNSWKAAFAASHSSCEIASSVASHQASGSARAAPRRGARPCARRRAARARAARRSRRRARLGHGGHVVAAPRLHRQQALRDEPRQRVVHGAARDAELGRELVQAELGARPGLARGGRAARSVS